MYPHATEKRIISLAMKMLQWLYLICLNLHCRDWKQNFLGEALSKDYHTPSRQTNKQKYSSIHLLQAIRRGWWCRAAAIRDFHTEHRCRAATRPLHFYCCIFALGEITAVHSGVKCDDTTIAGDRARTWIVDTQYTLWSAGYLNAARSSIDASLHALL